MISCSWGCRPKAWVLIVFCVTFLVQLPVSAEEEYEYIRSWGQSGDGSGEFTDIEDIGVDVEGNVYVLDVGDSYERVQKFVSSGNYIQQWGQSGSGPGQFSSIESVAAGEGYLYVTDGGGGSERVQKFTSSGDYVLQWGQSGSGPGEFHFIDDVAVDGEGKVYVGDHGRVQKFSSSGDFIIQWGQSGSGPGQFGTVQGLVVDSQGNVFVADHRVVQKFTSSGDYILQWGQSGSGPGQFSSIEDVAADSGGNVYVADGGRGYERVQKFTSSGNYVLQWGQSGSGPGQFSSIESLAADADGYVYVTDRGIAGERVQVFGPLGGEMIDVELVVLESPSISDTRPNLPESVKKVFCRDTFYAEIWTKNIDSSLNGITGGYLDLSFNRSVITATGLDHGDVYTNLSSGSYDNAAGRIDDLGGNADPGETEKGNDEWVRLGYVEFVAETLGTSGLISEEGGDTFARAGEGAVPWSAVQLNEPQVMVEVVWHCIYDIDRNGYVGTGDYAFLSAAWQSEPGDSNWDERADFDGNGHVGTGDYAWFSPAWHKDADDPTIEYPTGRSPTD